MKTVIVEIPQVHLSEARHVYLAGLFDKDPLVTHYKATALGKFEVDLDVFTSDEISRWETRINSFYFEGILPPSDTPYVTCTERGASSDNPRTVKVKKYGIVDGHGNVVYNIDSKEKAEQLFLKNVQIWYGEGRSLVGATIGEYEVEETDDTADFPKTYEKARKCLGTYGDSRPGRKEWAAQQLAVLAEAWNKIDGFDPGDMSGDRSYIPSFEYGSDGKWTCADSCMQHGTFSGGLEGLVCFKTEERAKQFGKQFIDLFREALR